MTKLNPEAEALIQEIVQDNSNELTLSSSITDNSIIPEQPEFPIQTNYLPPQFFRPISKEDKAELIVTDLCKNYKTMSDIVSIVQLIAKAVANKLRERASELITEAGENSKALHLLTRLTEVVN